jgi:WD40-like Beta Propeller Repeat
MNDLDRRLADELARLRLGDEEAAEERSWRVVSAALATRGGAPTRRRRGGRRALQVALSLVLIAALVSPAGASVRHWVAERIQAPGARHARPILDGLPGDALLLVDSSQGPWVVHPDGSKRLLGDWSEASWSPHGLFAVVTRGRELAAVELDGTVRWTLSRPGGVAMARWNGPDGFRIAYLEGRGLRLVDGDGSGDRRLAAGVARVAPAWLPGPGHVLAYATRAGGLVAIGADSGRELFTTARGPAVISLQWTAGNLLVARADRLQLLDRHGHATWTWTPSPGSAIASATARGSRMAVVLREPTTSRLILLTQNHRPRVLFAGPGRFAAPTWSPDGRWLLVPWPAADQWLFLHPGSAAAEPHAVANVAAQFAPGRRGAARFPTLAGWTRSR